MNPTTPQPPIPVYVYSRVSTDEQADSRLGLEAQAASIAAELDRRGWTSDGDYTDVASGKTTNGRPQLAAAIAAAKRTRGLIVAAKLDRISRDVIDFASLLRDADRQGWGILVLDLQVDTSTPAGRFTAITMANAAEFERRQIADRTRLALQAKKARGARLGRPHNTPQAVLDRVTRERDSGASWQRIADGLNADQVPTVRGGAMWRVSSVQRAYQTAQLDQTAATARSAR